ncbi:hypothetical protein IGI04_039975 [Brassica rapa subsp. trilocularis]|uniref:Aspartic peptidase DDI1-type domain-containing protein n=1 Tax=Brassica rapa subsp. trilocularis TaxID=1813537 RepID=A0ABQ7KMC2_BRACM|nr:hypothetical protein IGI04_039975 [Brassica rapa subsp. trilocularis]
MEDNFEQLLDDAPESMQIDQTSERRTLRKRKEKVPKHLKREVNEKEMDSFTKRVLMIPLDKPFEEAYFTHRLWMFFRETKETEQDIHKIFNQIREKMKMRITQKKKNDNGKFAVPCLVKGIEFPCEICDTGSSVIILPKVMADHLACDCNYEDEYEIKYSGSIDSETLPSINIAIHPAIDNKSIKSIDSSVNATFTLPAHFYPRFDADDSLQESFAVETELPQTRCDNYNEDYHRDKNIEYHGLAMDNRGLLHTWDSEGQERAMDGCILNISKEDIVDIIAINESSNFFH